jgi:BASS family bile acid:Na+ symporter
MGTSGFGELIMLALQASVFLMVFGFGLDATLGDVLYVVRRPGLFARSLVAMFVIMPAVAIALVRLFNFRQVVGIALVALSISPVPPLLPRREGQAGGRRAYALGLMALLALLSIVIVPGAVEVLERFAHRPLEMATIAVARAVFTTALTPLAAGLLVRTLLPAATPRIGAIVTPVAWVLLTLGIVVLLAANESAIWALAGNGTLLALTSFIAAALLVGHVLGGPDPDHAVVLALSNACRHPAVAVSIASANSPTKDSAQRFCSMWS